MGNSNQIAGVVGFFENPQAVIDATKKIRAANYESFDCFTPYPIHGLDQAQGLKRSPLPFITMGAGLTGFMCAVLLQYWTSVVDWPVNIGGKPMWSWPAFVPVFFELTVLFAGLCTVGGMFLLNGLPNTKKKSFDPSITRDRFAIMIDAPVRKSQEDLDEMEPDELARYNAKFAGFKPFSEQEAAQFLKSVGATETRTVPVQGWF